MTRFLPPAAIVLAATLTAGAAAQQLPCWNTNLGSSLGLTDESISAAQSLGFTFDYAGTSWTDIQVCDNGYVTLGATGGAPNFDPDPSTLVNDAFGRICPFWVDLEPGNPGSGDVFFNAVPAGGGLPAHAVITWLDVFEYLGAQPHTFQLVLIDGGAIRCAYGADLAANASPWLVGASPGGGVAQNPVSFTALPVTTSGNPTLHENDLLGGASPLAGRTLDWTPDGSGGFVVTEVTGCAGWSVYGTGCVAAYTSFYEWFQTTPSIDLSNSAIDLVFTGNGYVVSAGTTAFVAPSAAATNLNLTDDSETTVVLGSSLPYPGGTTSSLNVASNGHISTATNNAAFDFSPTPAEFLSWVNTTWAVWRDFIPGVTGAGTVWFEEVGTLSIVTWDAVIGYVGINAGTTPSTFQLQFDRATGNVAFVFLSLDTVSVSGFPGGEGWVVGFTTGGASLDPGSTDLSAVLGAGSIATAPADQAPLGLAATAPPVVNTTIGLVTSEITPNAVFGGLLFGFAKLDPGIDLTGFGMPGCFQHNDQLFALLFFPSGATTVTTPFNVPNFPGAPVMVQAASFDPSAMLTPLGAVASNGLELLLGN